MCPLTPMPFIWGINVVNSYYGLIQNNDVVNWAGSGLMVDGLSSFNDFNGNFVLRVTRLRSACALGSPLGLRAMVSGSATPTTTLPTTSTPT